MLGEREKEICAVVIQLLAVFRGRKEVYEK